MYSGCVITAPAGDNDRNQRKPQPSDHPEITDSQGIIRSGKKQAGTRNTGFSSLRLSGRITRSPGQNGFQRLLKRRRLVFQKIRNGLQQRQIGDLRTESQVGDSEPRQQRNGAEGVMFRVPQRPQHREREHRVRS